VLPGLLLKKSIQKIKKKDYENIEPELNRSLLSTELMKFDENNKKIVE
jgi:hypothetical protein